MSEWALEQLPDRFAFLDPASSKTPLRHIRARQAIIVIASDPWLRVFVLFAWAGRLTTEKLYEKILQVNEDFRPRLFGIEANAMQSFVGEAIALEAKRKGIRLPFVPVNQPTNIDKDFRIRTVLQPVVGWGRLFLQPSQLELKKEILGFPTAPIKDMVDALASAVALVPPRPTQVVKQESEHALEKYLRDSGASPAYIDQRLAEVRAGVRPAVTQFPLDRRFGKLYTGV